MVYVISPPGSCLLVDDQYVSQKIRYKKTYSDWLNDMENLSFTYLYYSHDIVVPDYHVSFYLFSWLEIHRSVVDYFLRAFNTVGISVWLSITSLYFAVFMAIPVDPPPSKLSTSVNESGES